METNIKQKLSQLQLLFNKHITHNTIKFLFNKEISIILTFNDKYIQQLIKKGELDYYSKYIYNKKTLLFYSQLKLNI